MKKGTLIKEIKKAKKSYKKLPKWLRNVAHFQGSNRNIKWD